jgi:hypothetical protein
MNKKLNILFLSNRPTSNTQAATVTEYLDSLKMFSAHNVFELSMLQHFPAKIDLGRFDIVITHYSLSLGPLIYHYLGKDLIERLVKFKGLKVAFLQDEYREIKTYWKNLNKLGIDVLFSCVPEHEIEKVYPIAKNPDLFVSNVLTGYVSKALLQLEVKDIKDRPFDVTYRTRKTPYWLGRLGQEKWNIAEEFSKRADGLGLHVDLSIKEGERMYGNTWNDFVASSRCVLGVESGASIIDFDGMLEKRVDRYMEKKPDASFEEVFEKLLSPYEGSLDLHQISPRCFEAAALRTPMVLFEGRYSGILVPDRHYIALKKDFSNFEEVIAKIKDHDYLQKMSERTYEEIARNKKYSYESFVLHIDEVLSSEFIKRDKSKVNTGYSESDFQRLVWTSWEYSIKRKIVLITQRIILGTPVLRKTLFGLWSALPMRVQQFVRPLARIVSR